jgi:hypothetical protein
LDLLRLYTWAGPKKHKRIIIQASHQLPVLRHWLQRSLQLCNKLAAVDLHYWLAHQALTENVHMWQGGNNDCWAARVISHLGHLDIVAPNTPRILTLLLNPVGSGTYGGVQDGPDHWGQLGPPPRPPYRCNLRCATSRCNLRARPLAHLLCLALSRAAAWP